MLSPFPSFSPTVALAGMLLGIALAALSPESRAGAADAPPPNGAAQYRAVDLKALVAKSRTDIPGQRIIFAPSPLQFRATLTHLPEPQKSDYLNMAFNMMQVSDPPKVSHRIGLDYGGERPLAAYIEAAAAARLAKEAQRGQALTFYAFHVYNNNRGPALVVTAFGR